jgi:cytohesin
MRENARLVFWGVLVIVSLFGCKHKSTESSEQSKERPQTIHEAAKVGNESAVKGFLANNVPVDTKDEFGVTPLHYAAAYGQKEVVKLLIDNGAAIEAENKGGGTPLGEAAMGVGSNFEVAELLIAKGANVNAKNFDGLSILHKAVMNGEPAIVQLLLANGANANITDKLGKTPLERAISLAEGQFRPGSKMAEKKGRFRACAKVLQEYQEKK